MMVIMKLLYVIVLNDGLYVLFMDVFVVFLKFFVSVGVKYYCETTFSMTYMRVLSVYDVNYMYVMMMSV